VHQARRNRFIVQIAGSVLQLARMASASRLFLSLPLLAWLIAPGVVRAEGTAAAPPAPAIDGADTAFVLIAAALVMVMTPGLGLFYGGMVRRKNVLATPSWGS
jgi:Amt family ammonium transporter